MSFFVRPQLSFFMVRKSTALGCVAAALLVGCGGDVVAVDENPAEDDAGGVGGNGGQGGNGGNGGQGGQGGNGGQGGGVGGGISIDCTAACGVLSPKAGCFESAVCEEVCASYNGTWLSDAADAFVQCAQEDPLCFETAEQCMWRTLYPKAVMATVEVSAVGLAPFEGSTLYGRLSEWTNGEPLVSGTIKNGSAVLTLPYEGPLAWMPIAQMFIDQDGDGMCASGDVSAYAFVQVSPPFETPQLEAAAGLADFQLGGVNCNPF